MTTGLLLCVAMAALTGLLLYLLHRRPHPRPNVQNRRQITALLVGGFGTLNASPWWGWALLLALLYPLAALAIRRRYRRDHPSGVATTILRGAASWLLVAWFAAVLCGIPVATRFGYSPTISSWQVAKLGWWAGVAVAVYGVYRIRVTLQERRRTLSQQQFAADVANYPTTARKTTARDAEAAKKTAARAARHTAQRQRTAAAMAPASPAAPAPRNRAERRAAARRR